MRGRWNTKQVEKIKKIDMLNDEAPITKDQNIKNPKEEKQMVKREEKQ